MDLTSKVSDILVAHSASCGYDEAKEYRASEAGDIVPVFEQEFIIRMSVQSSVSSTCHPAYWFRTEC